MQSGTGVGFSLSLYGCTLLIIITLSLRFFSLALQPPWTLASAFQFHEQLPSNGQLRSSLGL
jgi:hypothetical protein